MQVTVRPYGLLAAAVDADQYALSLPDSATVADALDELAAETGLDPDDVRVVLRDGRHLDPGTALADGDTLVLAERGAPE